LLVAVWRAVVAEGERSLMSGREVTQQSPVVLIVDDEIQIRRFLRAGFELENFFVREAGTAAEGIRVATLKPIDLVVLDLGLPDMEGSEIVERLRSWSSIPVIVLSVRSSEDEKVRLLELGADDYVVKPFGMSELMARARAALRRHTRGPQRDPIVRCGSLTIDLAQRSVMAAGEAVQLTPKEYRFLQVLARHAGNVVSHQQLLKEVWGKAQADQAHYLRIVVRKLRQKIERDPTRPAILKTELGVGYRLVVDPE
jgi:two-component system, OmpR family, KDP operon response regulator KdpE